MLLEAVRNDLRNISVVSLNLDQVEVRCNGRVVVPSTYEADDYIFS